MLDSGCFRAVRSARRTGVGSIAVPAGSCVRSPAAEPEQPVHPAGRVHDQAHRLGAGRSASASRWPHTALRAGEDLPGIRPTGNLRPLAFAARSLAGRLHGFLRWMRIVMPFASGQASFRAVQESASACTLRPASHPDQAFQQPCAVMSGGMLPYDPVFLIRADARFAAEERNGSTSLRRAIGAYPRLSARAADLGRVRRRKHYSTVAT